MNETNDGLTTPVDDLSEDHLSEESDTNSTELDSSLFDFSLSLNEFGSDDRFLDTSSGSEFGSGSEFDSEEYIEHCKKRNAELKKEIKAIDKEIRDDFNLVNSCLAKPNESISENSKFNRKNILKSLYANFEVIKDALEIDSDLTYLKALEELAKIKNLHDKSQQVQSLQYYAALKVKQNLPRIPVDQLIKLPEPLKFLLNSIELPTIYFNPDADNINKGYRKVSLFAIKTPVPDPSNVSEEQVDAPQLKHTRSLGNQE